MKPTQADLQAIINLKPDDAIAYLKRKGFAITWDWHSVDASSHARAFTVAKAASVDVLHDIRSALITNLEQGQTLADFKANLQPILQAKGWWGRQTVENPAGEEQQVQLGSPRRLDTIYQTNLQSAYMAGRYKAALDSAETHPYWMYVAVMDSITRPSHAALHGKVFRYDDPIWQHILPPNGYNCRCRFVALSADEVERRGLVVESSEGLTTTETIETGVELETGEINSTEVTVLKTTDKNGKPIRFSPDAGFDGSPANSHIMDDVLLQKAKRTLGEQAGTDEMQQVLLNPIRLKAWNAYIDNAKKLGFRQGQSMAFGVMQPTDIAFAKQQGAKLQTGLLFIRDELIAGGKARRHSQAGNALSQAEWKSLPERILNASQVLWDNANKTLMYVLDESHDLSTKVVVRFAKNTYGKADIDDAATVFKVSALDINSGLKSGMYSKVR
ncbi:phage minor head protein [Pseudomonas sp. F1_0610]|uniref:phage head morphogenesis protein n=1 Tax=Pseudomonas sp. F1_0610 TaxID=3114284 RepID=UPI0039C15CD7